MTAAKFKPLIFPVWGLALSNVANIIFKILDDFCLYALFSSWLPLYTHSCVPSPHGSQAVGYEGHGQSTAAVWSSVVSMAREGNQANTKWKLRPLAFDGTMH
jgi:hypothetical protein